MRKTELLNYFKYFFSYFLNCLSLLLERFRISKCNLLDLFLRYFENFKLRIISFSLLEGQRSKEYTNFNTTNSLKSRIIWEKTRISIYNALTIRIPEHIPEEIPRNIKHFLLLRTRFTWATKYVLLYLDKYLQYTYVMVVSKRSLDLFSIQL